MSELPHLFIATTGRRQDLSDRVAAWWSSRGFFPEWISCVAPRGSEELRQFDRERRIVAERAASTDIYILSDDDVLPRDDFEPRAFCDLLRSHPKYAQVSAWLDNEPLGPQFDDAHEECGCIMAVLDAGGLRAIRRGALRDFPPSTHERGAYDQAYCAALRLAGWRVGYALHCHATHIGKGRSEIWSDRSDTHAE